ncbi:hypothetical protein LSH36_1870g00001 [Paralvinella palmiformis]|uniref:Uncharacterized protein n=1 Tax=Paralvinella palmiformis TaxID=53620 RepID=A0AAD9MPV1_9ANNE|nr:hypothetical protein LSH36_1870g00001 [Paralvinella palmiformis]
MSLITIWHVEADQCIFRTFNDVKTTTDNVTELFVVETYKRNCEFLCYKKPSQCVAANIVVSDATTYWCELVFFNSTKGKRLLLESNPNEKHI